MFGLYDSHAVHLLSKFIFPNNRKYSNDIGMIPYFMFITDDFIQNKKKVIFTGQLRIKRNITNFMNKGYI